MIEGGVETLTPEGVFAGWLRDDADDAPAVLHIRAGAAVIAEAVARAFRRDLLAAGQGHGHFGFAARLRVALPPGPAAFELFLPRRGQGIPLRISVPKLIPPSPARVETLFLPYAAWKVADVARFPACLALAAQHDAMGTSRFVDVTFRFALRRWPSDAEAQVYAAALGQQRLTPEGMLVELLASRERADLGDDLASPWDPDFPYTYRAPAAPKRVRRRGAA